MGICTFLLTSFDYLRTKDPSISLASSSIMAHLHSRFLQTPSLAGDRSDLSLHHRQYNVKDGILESLIHNVVKDIEEIKPDVIATGVYVWNENFVNGLYESLSHTNYKPKYVILGGPQITYSPKGSLDVNYAYADFFVRGYGEESLGNLLKVLQQGSVNQNSIDGVHVRGQTDEGKKSQYTLSTLSSPMQIPNLIQHKGFIRWETKRGCPFECAFCQHKDSYEKRLRCNPTRINDEQTWMVKNGVNDISIVDPIYNSGGTQYLQNLQGFLTSGYTGRLNMQARFEMIKPEFLELCSTLKQNGINVELEFGIQTIIKKESQVIKRMNNLKSVVKSASELHARNIPFEVSLIYGLPEQTFGSFQSSIEWVNTFVKPTAIRAWPLMLLKGTSLYDMKSLFKLHEKILDEDLEELDETRQYKGIPHVVQSLSFTETEWNHMKSLALTLNSMTCPEILNIRGFKAVR